MESHRRLGDSDGAGGDTEVRCGVRWKSGVLNMSGSGRPSQRQAQGVGDVRVQASSETPG